MKKCLLVAIVFLVLGIFYSEKVQGDLADSLVRLHILANSDTLFDQQVKYEIRDKLLEKYGAVFSSAEEDQVQSMALSLLPAIEGDVQMWLEEKGVGYSARAFFARDLFPTKTYGESMRLPAGEYQALKIVLGEGNGQNWWCVMFPPICFADGSTCVIDEESMQYLKENLTQEEYQLITQPEESVQWKFKIVEVWQNIKGKFQ